VRAMSRKTERRADARQTVGDHSDRGCKRLLPSADCCPWLHGMLEAQNVGPSTPRGIRVSTRTR
jgi:hypothetical protein